MAGPKSYWLNLIQMKIQVFPEAEDFDTFPWL